MTKIGSLAVADEDAAAARGEEKAAFLLRLRSSGIRDLDLLRALEKIPREIFVPTALSISRGAISLCRSVAARRCLSLHLSRG